MKQLFVIDEEKEEIMFEKEKFLEIWEWFF